MTEQDRRERHYATIEAKRTPAGGWTKNTLAGWGVAWPPTSGWKHRLVDRWMLDEDIKAEWPEAWAVVNATKGRTRRGRMRERLRKMFKARSRLASSPSAS